MGAQQPKKITKATAVQIEMGCLKARIHLQLFRDRKNNEIIVKEKQLVNRLQSKQRNRIEQQLLFEQLVIAYHNAQACNILAGYANHLRGQAGFLANNQDNLTNLQQVLPMVYSLMYAAKYFGLFSLVEFKKLMEALNYPQLVDGYVTKQIKLMLTSLATPVDVNNYVLEVAQRNGIALEMVNYPGHNIMKKQNKSISKQGMTIKKQLGIQFDKKQKRLIEEGMGELTLNKPMYPLSNPNDIMKNLVAQKEVTKEPKTIPQEEPKRQPNNHKQTKKSIKDSVNDLQYYPDLPPVRKLPNFQQVNANFQSIYRKLKAQL